MRNLLILIILAGLTLPSVFVGGADKETLKIMPFVDSGKPCIKCHRGREGEIRRKTPARSCATFCVTCHRKIGKNTGIHHPVDVRLTFPPKYAFSTSRNNRITCITCHDLNKKRYDTRAWKSESLFEKIFRSRNRYRTFYLVIRNIDGALCKKCHY